MGVTVLYKSEHPGVVLNSKICLGNTHILTGCMDGKVRLFHAKGGEMIKVFLDKELMNKVMSVTGLAILKNDSSASSFVASYSEGHLKYWSLLTGNCIRTIKEERQIMGLAQNPRDNQYLSLGVDGTMHYYDFETGRQIRSFASGASNKAEGHTSRVFSAVFHPKKVYEFVSGGWDNTVLFWDLRKPTAFRHIMGPHICGEGLDINSTGHLIASFSYSVTRPFQLFDYNTGKNYLTLEYEGNKLYCGKWVAPMYIATGSSDPSILKVVDMFSIKEIMSFSTHDSGIFSIDSINLKTSQKQTSSREDLAALVYIACGTSLFCLKLDYAYQSTLDD